MSEQNLTFSFRLFEPHEGSTFELVREGEEPLTMILREVSETTPRGFDGEQFSLVFQGPPQPELAQRIYSLKHEELGSIELFLVPIGAPEEGRLYEAYFNLTFRTGV